MYAIRSYYVKSARYDVPAGSLQSHEQEVMVRANASVTKPKEIERLIIRDNVRMSEPEMDFYPGVLDLQALILASYNFV